jgi:hypothetical protein
MELTPMEFPDIKPVNPATANPPTTERRVNLPVLDLFLQEIII